MLLQMGKLRDIILLCCLKKHFAQHTEDMLACRRLQPKYKHNITNGYKRTKEVEVNEEKREAARPCVHLRSDMQNLVLWP